MKMTVIGLGYLGVTHAIAMSKIGHTVYGVDPDESKVNMLNSGKLPFYEPGLEEELHNAISLGLLSFSVNHKSTSSEADLHWICVGTPQSSKGGNANTDYLEDAFKSVLKVAKEDSIVVGKSTVPVGTYKNLMEILETEKSNVRLAWNPEFLREGTALQDSLNPDRIVIGDNDDGCYQIIVDAYRGIIKDTTPLVHTNIPTAELVKVASNSFLATKISFINAVAEMSELTGADVRQIAEAMGYDERIGNKFLRAGIGFGGGCLPKDIRAFKANAQELGIGESFNFLDQVDFVNNRRREKVVSLTLDALGTLEGKAIAVLGASFKPNSDDIRESPALEIALKLSELGAEVKIHDPKANQNVKQLNTNLIVEDNLYDVFNNSDIILHLTEWQEYRNLDLEKVSKLVNQSNVIDGRLALDSELWENHGFNFKALGIGYN
jgi:UDPglucose 6-dehydrogenase